MTTRILLTFLLFVGISGAQSSIDYVDNELYVQAVDKLLPMDVSGEAWEEALLIRVKPYYDPEFLIKIILLDGRVTVNRRISASGNLKVYFEKLLETEKFNSLDALVGKVVLDSKVSRLSLAEYNRQKLTLSRLAASLIAKGPRTNAPRLGKTSESLVLLHGTHYEVRYLSRNGEKISFYAHDQRMTSKEVTSELVTWIKKSLTAYRHVELLNSSD